MCTESLVWPDSQRVRRDKFGKSLTRKFGKM